MEKREYIRIIHIAANLYLGSVLETFPSYKNNIFLNFILSIRQNGFENPFLLKSIVSNVTTVCWSLA